MTEQRRNGNVSDINSARRQRRQTPNFHQRSTSEASKRANERTAPRSTRSTRPPMPRKTQTKDKSAPSLKQKIAATGVTLGVFGSAIGLGVYASTPDQYDEIAKNDNVILSETMPVSVSDYGLLLALESDNIADFNAILGLSIATEEIRTNGGQTAEEIQRINTAANTLYNSEDFIINKNPDRIINEKLNEAIDGLSKEKQDELRLYHPSRYDGIDVKDGQLDEDEKNKFHLMSRYLDYKIQQGEEPMVGYIVVSTGKEINEKRASHTVEDNAYFKEVIHEDKLSGPLSELSNLRRDYIAQKLAFQESISDITDEAKKDEMFKNYKLEAAKSLSRLLAIQKALEESDIQITENTFFEGFTVETEHQPQKYSRNYSSQDNATKKKYMDKFNDMQRNNLNTKSEEEINKTLNISIDIDGRDDDEFER